MAPLRELDLLALAIGQSARSSQASSATRITIPSGDDLAAVTIDGATVLVGCDQLIAGLHYEPGEDVRRVGHKAIARNASDAAAMAALPVACVVSVLFPGATQEARAGELLEALRVAGDAMGCPVIGGDLAIGGDSNPETLSVTILAESAGIAPICRGTANVGDHLYCTGVLGDSLSSGHHLDFTPRVTLARTLAGDPETRPTAMMDLSDGVAMDLPRLLAPRPSEDSVGHAAVVELSQLPLRDTIAIDSKRNLDAKTRWRRGLGDGEDYELLFTAHPDATIPDQIEGIPITRIGIIVPADSNQASIHYLDAAGQPVDTTGLGYEHCADG